MERPFPAYKGDHPYIFVSYAHADDSEVYPEISWLNEQDFNIYYDEGISPGSSWTDVLAKAVEQCHVFLYYLSPRSVQSVVCTDEVNYALTKHRQVLTVHLEETELPPGLEMSLGRKQAIIRRDYSEEPYRRKLSESLKSLLPDVEEAPPIVVSDANKQRDEKSIAVIPLLTQSSDPDDENLSDGISEELMNGLSKIDGLHVAGRMASFEVKNQNIGHRALAERLGAEFLLSGRFQKSGNRVRINVQLNRALDGRNMWSEKYDETLDDIFELQDRIVERVIAALKIRAASHPDLSLLFGAFDEAIKSTLGHEQTAVEATGSTAVISPEREDDDGKEIGPGRILKNRFVLEQLLGSRGMGDVYKALDLRQQEAHEHNPYVAIKLLKKDFAQHKDSIISLQREMSKTRHMRSEHIMGMYDFDAEGDTVFVAMELVSGMPLSDFLKEHPEGVSREDAWNIIRGICEGLKAAHALNIVHSDFKPGNIFYTEDKVAKVFDFGIARAIPSTLVDDDAGQDREGTDTTVFDPVTLGALTPAFASYEMLTGQVPAKSDDVYAVALVAYELFTGKHPYNRAPADKALARGMQPEPIPFLKRR